MILVAINLIASFGVFAAVCWRLRETQIPAKRTPAAFTQWVLWLLVHVGIAIPNLPLPADFHQAPPASIVLLKCAIAVLFLAPWRRRESDQ